MGPNIEKYSKEIAVGCLFGYCAGYFSRTALKYAILITGTLFNLISSIIFFLVVGFLNRVDNFLYL